MRELAVYFLIFIFYSVIGWIMEVINAKIRSKHFINRGFLFGPWYPIYGLGGVFITLLTPNNPILIFIISFVICAIIEYLTSYFLERLFHARWWDYTSDKINIQGRICLRNLILFGICGLVVKLIISPMYFSIIRNISNKSIYIITIILIIIYLIDTIVSIKIITQITKNKHFPKVDNTNEIRNNIKNYIGKLPN